MSTTPIVIRFDVLKYRSPNPYLGMPPFENVQFPFERFEKAFSTGIVPPIPLPAHAPATAGHSLARVLRNCSQQY